MICYFKTRKRKWEKSQRDQKDKFRRSTDAEHEFQEERIEKDIKTIFFFKKAEKNSEEKQESIEQKVMECQGETLKKDLSLGIYLLEFQK